MMESYDALICTYKGEERIKECVRSLVEQTFPPSHIVIVSPSQRDISLLDEELQDLVTHVESPIANQCVQRLIGLTHSESEYIFQLDDDMLVDKHCVENMAVWINENPLDLVSPVVKVEGNRNRPLGSNWKRLFEKSRIFRIYLRLQGFRQPYKPLSILKNGAIVPLYRFPEENMEVDWLHSCRLYYRKSIYGIEIPLFNGKSYFEDVFSSLEMRKRGNRLVLHHKAFITHPYSPPVPRKELARIGRLQLRLAKLQGRVGLDIYVFLILEYVCRYVYMTFVQVWK